MELKNLPDQYASGETISWTISLDDYPSSEWTLSYHLRGAAAVNVTAVANTDLTYTATLHATAAAGKYFWQAYVTNIATSTVKRMVDSGTIQILPDLSGVTIPPNYDGRSKAELLVEAIDAMFAKKATRDQESYTIGQRTLKRIPSTELIVLRNYYAKVVEGERIKARVEKGHSPFENIYVEFRPSGRGSR